MRAGRSPASFWVGLSLQVAPVRAASGRETGCAASQLRTDRRTWLWKPLSTDRRPRDRSEQSGPQPLCTSSATVSVPCASAQGDPGTRPPTFSCPWSCGQQASCHRVISHTDRHSCGSEGHAEVALGACQGCCVSSHSVHHWPGLHICPFPLSMGDGAGRRCLAGIHVLGLSQLITTNWMASHVGIYFLPLSPGGWKSKTKAPAGPRSFCMEGGRVLPPLPASGGSRHFTACGRIAPISTSIVTWLFPVCLCPKFSLLMRRPDIGCGLSLIQYGFSLSHLQRPYFQRRTQSHFLGGPEFGGGHHSAQYSMSMPVVHYSNVCICPCMYVRVLCFTYHLSL